MRLVGVRLVAMAGCGFCLVTAWAVFEMRMSGRGAQSVLGIMACVLSLVMGLGCGGLALLPNRLWQAALVEARCWLDRLAEVASSMSNLLATVLVIAAGVVFLLIARHLAPLQDLEKNSDQGAYLQAAEAIRHDGGPLHLIGNLMTGRFSEANRHPLYLALLSLWPTQFGGQLLSVTFGLAAIWGLAPLVLQKFGASVAAVYSVLLATNFAFCYASTLVMCESLMVLLATAGWLWFGLPERDCPRTDRAELCSQFAAGCCWGMLYLTKGTGLLWLVGYCGWLVITPTHDRDCEDLKRRDATPPRGRLNRIVVSLMLVAAGWVLVVSPLLVRNRLRFGSFTYNVNSWLLFVDEFQDPEALAGAMTLGEAAWQYWQSHTLFQIVERGAMGLVWVTFILGRGLGPVPLGESRILFGVPFLVLALIGLMSERRVNPMLLPIWLAVCLPVFGWYVPVAAGERFVLPLVPPLLVLASNGVVRLAHLWQIERASRRIAIGCLVWLIGWTVLTLRISEL